MINTQPTETTKEPVALAPDELASLDQGIRSAETERHYTLEEVVEFARKRRSLWKEISDKVAA